MAAEGRFSTFPGVGATGVTLWVTVVAFGVPAGRFVGLVVRTLRFAFRSDGEGEFAVAVADALADKGDVVTREVAGAVRAGA